MKVSVKTAFTVWISIDVV